MDIYNKIKNSKLLTALTKMNIFISSFVLLMVFLIFGGVMGRGSQSLSPQLSPKPNQSNKDLRLVHVVMRHGIRAPVSLYPNDPYQGFTFPPNGRGQLTMKGIAGAYDVGTMLRERYDSFLGSRFNVSEFYAESTGVDRAQATLMSVNTGLWPPGEEQRFRKDVQWFPVPVFMTNMDDDMLLLVAKDCPQYNFERTRVENSPEVQNKLATYKEMMQDIEANSGQSMKTFDDIGDIYATMLAEQTYGLTLPTWVHSYWERMEEAASYSFVIKAYNAKMQRLKGGLLLKKLLQDWTANIDGSSAKKMFLYGGHDSTIANLLSALQVFEPQVPHYAMSIFFELSFDSESQKYGLEIFTKNSTLAPIQLQLPGCEQFCPIQDVIKLTNNVIPQNWEAECATEDPDYTPPPFEGP